LRSFLPKIERELPLAKDAGEEFEADMLVFAEGAATFSGSNGTYSREDIYFGYD
jgi:hypothetical protein